MTWVTVALWLGLCVFGMVYLERVGDVAYGVIFWVMSLVMICGMAALPVSFRLTKSQDAENEMMQVSEVAYRLATMLTISGLVLLGGIGSAEI